MTEEDEEEAGTESGEDPIWERETAPQSPYTSRDVAVGVVVAVIGVAVTFGLPLVLLGI